MKFKSLREFLFCCMYKQKPNREGTRHLLVVPQVQVVPVHQLSPKQGKIIVHIDHYSLMNFSKEDAIRAKDSVVCLF